MGLAIASLLVHDQDVPVAVRNALLAAQDAPRASKVELLRTAARILHREVGVECPEALELVGLAPGDCPSRDMNRSGGG